MQNKQLRNILSAVGLALTLKAFQTEGALPGREDPESLIAQRARPHLCDVPTDLLEKIPKLPNSVVLELDKHCHRIPRATLALGAIHGVGPARAKSLLDHVFTTNEELTAASGFEFVEP